MGSASIEVSERAFAMSGDPVLIQALAATSAPAC
jgi:hypothetical protein